MITLAGDKTFHDFCKNAIHVHNLVKKGVSLENNMFFDV